MAAESEINPAETAFGERPVSRSALGSPPHNFRDDQWLCGSDRIDYFFLEPG